MTLRDRDFLGRLREPIQLRLYAARPLIERTVELLIKLLQELAQGSCARRIGVMPPQPFFHEPQVTLGDRVFLGHVGLIHGALPAPERDPDLKPRPGFRGLPAYFNSSPSFFSFGGIITWQ